MIEDHEEMSYFAARSVAFVRRERENSLVPSLLLHRRDGRGWVKCGACDKEQFNANTYSSSVNHEPTVRDELVAMDMMHHAGF